MTRRPIHTPSNPARNTQAQPFRRDAFVCYHCSAHAVHYWGQITKMVAGGSTGPHSGFDTSTCSHCGELTIWHLQKVIYPRALIGPEAHAEAPAEVADDFNEARSIAQDSPRGAAALLRLCIQKLCKHLGEKGENINEDIKQLVKKGLPIQVQQAIDTVRVVGNNAVHPGELDLRDDVETVTKLFDIVNIIVQVMIAQPKQISALYTSIVTQSTRDAIDKRDTPKP